MRETTLAVDLRLSARVKKKYHHFDIVSTYTTQEIRNKGMRQ